MKKYLITLLFIVATMSLSLNSYAAATLHNGTIDQVNYIKHDITINGVSYKLSNTVKVYGFGGDKYLDVKKLTSSMTIDYQYSKRKGESTISSIWVQPD